MRKYLQQCEPIKGLGNFPTNVHIPLSEHIPTIDGKACAKAWTKGAKKRNENFIYIFVENKDLH